MLALLLASLVALQASCSLLVDSPDAPPRPAKRVEVSQETTFAFTDPSSLAFDDIGVSVSEEGARLTLLPISAVSASDDVLRIDAPPADTSPLDLESAVIAHRFDGPSPLEDLVGEFDVAADEATLSTAGLRGGALRLTSPGAPVTLAGTEALALESFTLSAWVNLDAPERPAPGVVIGNLTRRDTMDAAQLEIIDLDSLLGDPFAQGFTGMVFDGRYIYGAPYLGATSGKVFRFDTTMPINDLLAWESFDIPTELEGPTGFSGALFDGRIITFVPFFGAGYHNTIVRYDTRLRFSDAMSWRIVTPPVDVVALPTGFIGGVFAGDAHYFAPDAFENNTPSGQVLKMTGGELLDDPITFELFNVAALNSAARTFYGATFDGRYVYLSGSGRMSLAGALMARYDTHGPFEDASSWLVFDAALTEDVTPLRLTSPVFDGRTIHFGTLDDSALVDLSGGASVTYDTRRHFKDVSAWRPVQFPESQQTAPATAFDGRFVYTAPSVLDGSTGRSSLNRVDVVTGATDSLELVVEDVDVSIARSFGFDGRHLYVMTNPDQDLDDTFGRLFRLDTCHEGGVALMTKMGKPGGGWGDGPRGPVAHLTTTDGFYTLSAERPLDAGWHHLAFTFTPSRSEAVLYVDGVPVDSATVEGPLAMGTNPLRLGGDRFEGRLDDVLVFERALPQETILALYNASLRDNVEGADAAEGVLPGLGNSIAFDGDDLIDVALDLPSVTGALSLEAWVRLRPGDAVTAPLRLYDAAAVDPPTASVFGLGELTTTLGYAGVVTTSRYVYLVPSRDSTGAPHANVLRYDRAASARDPDAWEAFDASTIGDAPALGFAGGAFDGRYIYFAPQETAEASHARVLRFDTDGAFADPAAWAVHDAKGTSGLPSAGYRGAHYDAARGVVTFIPASNSDLPHGVVLQYDTSADFDAETSWTAFDIDAVLTGLARGFSGAVSTPGSTHLVPEALFEDGAATGFWHHDDAKAFDDPSAWTGRPIDAFEQPIGGFSGAAFDGRYVYYAPGATERPFIVRYDTEGGDDAASYLVLDARVLSGVESVSFEGVIFDGQFVTFLPSLEAETALLRYDTHRPIDALSAWRLLPTQVPARLNSAFTADGDTFLIPGDRERGERTLHIIEGQAGIALWEGSFQGGALATAPSELWATARTSRSGALLAAPLTTDSEWHHLAITLGDGILRFFVDGQIRAERPLEEAFTLERPRLRLGYGFSGDLDSIIVWDRVLSPDDLALRGAPHYDTVPQALEPQRRAEPAMDGDVLLAYEAFREVADTPEGTSIHYQLKQGDGPWSWWDGRAVIEAKVTTEANTADAWNEVLDRLDVEAGPLAVRAIIATTAPLVTPTLTSLTVQTRVETVE